MLRNRWPLLSLAAFALLSGLWAALVRLGWPLPNLPLPIAGQHGALMVSGFLGTLISLERAVALNWRPAFLSPLFSGLGLLWLILGLPLEVGRALIALGALGLVIVFVRIIRLQPATFTLVMGLGAVCWLMGDVLWLLRQPLQTAVLWWMGFLVLTIAGERLELGRLLRLRRWAQVTFIASVSLLLSSAALAISMPMLGWGMAGAGLGALGLWLFVNDIARRTVRGQGLPRYIAVCLLLGYGWLVVGGALSLLFSTQLEHGWFYDARLHTVLLGFVFSMIFGHAPIILPALLNRLARYTPLFYFPLAALHLSLTVRVLGDLAGIESLRLWGGLFNVAAILAFLPLEFFMLWQSEPFAQPISKPVT